MNMISSFNKTMDYIEMVLDDEIEEKKIVQLSGYSYAMFSRMFSILTDMSFAEYIRLRRLTEAAINLRESREKIIDIAIKYGYDSSDSFGYAFKNFHGCSPTEVRKGKPYMVVSRIQLTLGIKGGRKMDIKIQKVPAFTVAGVKKKAIDSSMCPKVWDELFEKCSFENLDKMGSGQSYGVCYDMEDAKVVNYMATYDVRDKVMARKLKLEVMEIPENEYAVVKLKGSITGCIHEGWKYIMEVFFPEHGYMHSGDPDFEVYSEGDMSSPDYEMELWVPIKKAV